MRSSYNKPAATALLALLLAAGCTNGELRPRDGELRLHIGPMRLTPGHVHGAAHGTHQGGMQESFDLLAVTEAGWVTSFLPQMEEASGAPAPTALLHHVVVGRIGLSGDYCLGLPLLPGARPLLASGAEATRVQLPDGYGIALAAGDRLAVWGMFHNPTHRPYDGVRFAGRIGYTVRTSGRELIDVDPLWIDVKPTCPKHGYKVPPGGRHVTTRRFEFPRSGRLVYGAGHLHDHGVSLRIFRETDGAELVRFEPRLDGNGHLLAIAPVTPSPPREVHPGERYVLEAVYDNPTEFPLWSMGIAVLMIAPS